jgi:NADPH-dependent curcumin reductase CurA
MQGFIYLDYLERQAEAVAYLADLKDKGKLQYEYTIRGPGVEHCVGALQALFEGKNDGKM